MPTYHDETLQQRYAREHLDFLKMCGAMTPAEVAALHVELNNARARIAELERERDTARLEGWQVAREQAAKEADNLPSRWDGNVGMMLTKELSAKICAMHPPAEWQCAEVAPVCGAAPNTPRHLSPYEIKAMVGEEDFRKTTKWPHDDGFGGGLTERDG